MTPEQQRPASSSSSKLLDGEIVALEDDRARVRLDSGVMGVLLGIANTPAESPFLIGQHRQFAVLQCDEDGEVVLTLASSQDKGVSPGASANETDEPHNVLTDRHTPPKPRDDEGFPTLDEQRIQHWLNRVEKNLAQLRRNRAKRLDEEFYSGS